MKTRTRQILVLMAAVGFGFVIGLVVAGQPPAAQTQQNSPGVISAPIRAPMPALTTRSNWNFATTGSTGVFIPGSNQAASSEAILRQLDSIRTQHLSIHKGLTRSSTNEFLYDKVLPRDGFAPRSRGNTDLIDFRASPPDLRK